MKKNMIYTHLRRSSALVSALHERLMQWKIAECNSTRSVKSKNFCVEIYLNKSILLVHDI